MSLLKIAQDLREQLRADEQPDGHIGKVRSYLRGTYAPYMPPGSTPEFKHIAWMSRTNWLPLVPGTFTKSLYVDGYRSESGEDMAAWSYWQANQMDAKQTTVHRTAIAYGTSYTLVLPGVPTPLIRPLKVTEVATGWSDTEAMWPDYALVRTPWGWWLYDDQSRYPLADSDGMLVPAPGRDEESHGLGVCPVVRYRTSLDDEPMGMVEPLIPLQQRIDATVFDMQIALHYAAFRQRYASGLVIPTDPETGEKKAEFTASVDRLWFTEDADTRWGDFAQTDVSGHLQAYISGVRTLAALAQLPPTVMLGELVNVSTEALAAIYDATTRLLDELSVLLGESHEQTLRLASAAAGDAAGAMDFSAEVRWRENEARSLSATVDALGKLHQMLGVPASALWERVPNVTDQELAMWRARAEEGDSLATLASVFAAQNEALVDDAG